MNVKWKRTLLALVLTAALLLSMPVFAMAAEETPTGESGAGTGTSGSTSGASTEANYDLDLTRTITLTIEPSGSATFKTDLNDYALYAYDIYKVADAVQDTGFSSFHFEISGTGAFADLTNSMPLGYDDLPRLDPETGTVVGDANLWSKYAQRAAQFVLDHSIAPTTTVVAVKDIASTVTLPAGLYLVLARSNNDPLTVHGKNILPDKTDYFNSLEDASTTPSTTKLVTQVRSTEYLYSFMPELIVLPFPQSEIPSGSSVTPVSTAGGHWEYSVKAVLKPTRELRYGNLKVVKDLNIYNDTENTAQVEPVSFVFRVQVEKKRMDSSGTGTATEVTEYSFDDYIMFTFTAPDEEICLFEEKFPVGARVLVTEVYSGAGYVLNSAKTVGSLSDDSFVILPIENEKSPITATFANKVENELIHGYGVLNQYQFDGRDWQIVSDADSEGTYGSAFNSGTAVTP